MANTQYDEFIRIRITELRIAKNISEHKMSLDLDKSGSYIRGITSGAALPSLRELFNIISYFDMTPAEFFKEIYDEGEEESEMSEKIKSPDNWDGELKIYNLEDRLAVSTILIKNGYDVGQHQRKKDQNSKALDYFLHFTAVNGNTASK